MSLPFLQVAQKGFALARLLAGALGTDRHRCASLLWDLWALSLELGPSGGAPTGVLPGPDADKCLARALEWRRDPTTLVDGLVRFGLVERLEGGDIRIKGTDRYASAYEGKQARDERRSEAGRIGAAARWDGKRAPAAQPSECDADATAMRPQCDSDAVRCLDVDRDVDREEETQTREAALPLEPVSCETSATHDEPPAARDASSLPSPSREQTSLFEPARAAPAPKASSAHQAAVAALVAAFLAARGTGYRWQRAKDGEALKSLLAHASLEEILRRWEAALALGDKWPGCNTVAQLASKWNDLASLTPRAQAPPRACEACGTADGYMGETWRAWVCAECSSAAIDDGVASADEMTDWVHKRQEAA